MVTKKELLSNLREYSSDQVAEAINSGVVTLYELSKSGNLTPLMRKRIEEKLSRSVSVNQEHSTVSPAEATEGKMDFSKTDNVDVSVQPSHHNVIPCAEDSNGKDEKNTEEQTQENHSEVAYNKGMFKRPFSFKGRITRSEYGLSYAIFFVIFSAVSFISEAIGGRHGRGTLFLILAIPCAWFILAQGAKRLHDMGHSGWSQLVYIIFILTAPSETSRGIAVYSLSWYLCFCILPLILSSSGGDEYANKYGRPPKGKKSEVITYKGMFKRPFSFKGRIRRLEYGLSIIIYFVYLVTVRFIIGVIVGNMHEDLLFLISLILAIPVLWFMLAQGAKRFHDTGETGWLQLACVFCPLYVLFMLLCDGDKFANEYGEAPKGRDIHA